MDAGWSLALIVLWVLVAFLTVIVLALARTVGLLQLQLGPMPGGLATEGGLPLNSEAPPFSGVQARGRSMFSWDDPNRTALLLFVTPTCSACRDALRDAVRITITGNYSIPIVAISHGSREQNALIGASAERLTVVSDEDGALFDRFQVEQVPLGVLVITSLVRRKAIVNNRDQIEALLEGHARTVSEAIWETASAGDQSGSDRLLGTAAGKDR